MNRHAFLTILSIMALQTGAVTDNFTTSQQARLQNVESQNLQQLVWNNPALKHWNHTYSLSQVELSWQLRHEDEPINTQLGDHETVMAFDASTYMHHGNSTMWGRAYYNNGRQRGIKWNETSDLQMVYPYVLADSVDTNTMNLERYSFMGGYSHLGKRITWGASVGYKAGLYYRRVDPRPRNVTADLDLKAGIGCLIGRYAVAFSLAFKNYKQTNNVSFYSELGSDKLYHLTGLTNDYGRFAGTGYSTYYKGQQWAASLDMHPIEARGVSASVQVSRLAFDNVLTSLNKLPMSHVTHNALAAEATWLASSWRARTHLAASRRVGTENVFGDPSAQVYQQIGQLDMYHENRFNAGIEGVYEHHWTKAFVGLHPALDYHHLNTIYADPQCRWRIDDLTAAVRMQGGADLRYLFMVLTMGVQWVHPTYNQLLITATKTELMGLQRAIERDFGYQSHNRVVWTAALTADVPVTGRYVLRAKVDWSHGRYWASNQTHHLFTSISFIF